MAGTDMDLDQHYTRTTLTTSLDKTGSQKHSFSDIQIHSDTPTNDINDLLALFPFAFTIDIPVLNRRAHPQRMPPKLSQASTPILSNAEALSALYNLNSKAYYRESVKRIFRP